MMDSVKAELKRVLRDSKELAGFMGIMSRRMPLVISSMVHEDPKVIETEIDLNNSGKQHCVDEFNRKIDDFVSHVSSETLRSMAESTHEFRNILIGVWKQLAHGPTMALAKQEDAVSANELQDFLYFTNENLKYEEDSIKTLESSSIEAVRIQLHHELERIGIFEDIQSCLYA
ncbi:hypothetical protein QAD02_016900 [Eretmocerus hayati]|uniref:Uncharacterized protein n=1 Tax=Eretmocerus hayati TaxID=131215 RepID=A0ACC2PCD5_9HYME|nr:hypothetical protein QAD02_016900 [Eretmocerus hayati]